MIVIEDAVHDEHDGKFTSFDDAVAELRRRSAVPWDEPPNRAPCTSWKKCRREYYVLEYELDHAPWNLLRRVAVMKLSSKGVEWVADFEQAWEAAGWR